MKTLRSLLLVILSTSLTAFSAPRLVVSTPSLNPESKVDLVLDFPVVETSAIGTTADNSWLVVDPPWPGKLRWKSQTIAEFMPDQAPALGATYRFSIPADRKHLDGTAVPEGPVATLQAEELRVSASHSPNRWSSDYSPSKSQWILVFNDHIDPAAAAPFIRYASADGRHVAAKVTLATGGSAGGFGREYKSWADRWLAAQAPAGETENSQNLPDDAPVPHVLMIRPSAPLPAGKGWHLQVLQGLPNKSGNSNLVSESQYTIGDIDGFMVREITARTVANEPRRVVISFNQPLADQLPADFLESGLQISPRPENLAAAVEDRSIILTGDLLAHDKYTVTPPSNLVSDVGFPLLNAGPRDIVFEHLRPGVGLPSDDVGQLAKGTRKYRIFTQNLDRMQVRIKKLEGTDLIRAFQGYRHFSGKGPDHKVINPTFPLPYSLVVGTPLVDREIKLGNPIDTTRIVSLDWNKDLPADMSHAVLFLECEGTPHQDCDTSNTTTTQAIVQLTDIGLAWKITESEAFIHAFSCETGAPLAGVKLQLFGEDAAPLDSVLTDESGLATLPRLPAARHLHASLGPDNYITAFDSTLETVGLWNFPVRYSWNKPLEAARQVLMFTDRSLYRPGETVRMKGILRTLSGNTILAAKPSPANLIILDPSEKEILRRPVTISERGSFDFTHQLAPGKTGTHLIRLEFSEELEALGDPENDDEGEMDWYERERLLENARFEIPLPVEEFRRNAFEVIQSIPTPATGASSVAVNLTAKYYQGQPVAAGSVNYYSQVTTRNPYPERFRDFQFGNHRTYDWAYWYHYFGYGDDEWDRSGESTQLQNEATLSADGSATFEVEIPKSDFPTAREVMVASEVTDANNQTLTARSTTTVHPASVYVGVSRIDRLARVGEPVEVRLVAIDPDGQPYAAPLQLTASVSREVNSPVKTRNDDGETSTRNDVSEQNQLSTSVTLDPAASTREGQPFTFTPEANGLHFLTVSGTDPDGRAFATVTRIHVYGTREYPWQYEDGMRIKLVAEKKSYQPGETARILVLSPIEGTALVTVEREKVLRSFQLPLKMENPVIEVPLTDADAPNAYVSVLVIKGAGDSAREFKEPQLRLGYCEVMVENQTDRLKVAIQTSSETNRPGEDVLLTGTVLLADGKPAAGAEVTLYAEDEGTLAVMGYDTPDPMAWFYRPRILGVEAGTSFSNFVPEDPDMQTFNNKGFFVGGGGDLGKLADLMRKNFDPCATWAPALITDDSGHFNHAFRLPDTLTRYRIIAVAHHDVQRFGHAESSLIVSKDLMLEPKTPRFAHQTDTIHPQVLVQNASEFAGTWQIEYNPHAADGTPVCRALGPPSETVTLAAGASATLVFPTITENTGQAVLSWKATPVSLDNTALTPQLARRLSDAVEQRFEVGYPVPLIRQVRAVKFDKPGQALDLGGLLDPKLLDGSGHLDLEIARSPLIEAAGSVDYLLQYPYGCVEQTTSSLLPWCSVDALKGLVPSFAGFSGERVAKALQSGADRLLSMQLADGSFSYWPGSSERVEWATPYAGLGLILAIRSGAQVPESATEALAQYLIGSLRGMSSTRSATDLETHARSLLVLALAGKPQVSYQENLSERSPELTAAARALLAAAIAVSNPGDPATLTRARDVLTSKAPLPENNDDWMPWSPNRALELIAWLTIDPNAPETSAALDRMLAERSPAGHWRNTWVNGWTLIAMARYAESSGDLPPVIAMKLETSTGPDDLRITSETPTITRRIPLGPNFKLTLDSDQPVFLRMRLASKPPVTPLQPVANNGLAIERIHERILPDGAAELLTEPKVGDLVRVTLRVTLPGDDSRYLVIEDPLPAMFEAVNSRFASQNTALGLATSEHDWNVSHSELRDDRAVFFVDQVSRKGTYTVTYLARCTLAAQATAPPAKVESMYDPDNFALSASRVFDSR